MAIVCSNCKEEKPADQFHWRRKGKERHNECMACRNKYKRGPKKGSDYMTTLEKESVIKKKQEDEAALFNSIITRSL